MKFIEYLKNNLSSKTIKLCLNIATIAVLFGNSHCLIWFYEPEKPNNIENISMDEFLKSNLNK